jgi:hypothetical protein
MESNDFDLDHFPLCQDDDGTTHLLLSAWTADPDHLWFIAIQCLRQKGDARPIAALLRAGIPPSVSDRHELADFLDPDPEWATYRLELKKFRNRKWEKKGKFGLIANEVFAAERAGEKRYLAVEKVAKRIGKTERHVWEALEFHKENYQGAVRGVIDITQSGTFARDTTVVTIHSQTGSGAVLRPIIISALPEGDSPAPVASLDERLADPDPVARIEALLGLVGAMAGTLQLFHVQEPGKDYQSRDNITFADAVNGGSGSARLVI